MQDLFTFIDGQTDYVVDLQRRLTAIPAVGPKNGGEGEGAKADFLRGHLRSLGFESIHDYPAPDPSVPCGERPNLAAIIPGQDRSRTMWVISHLDIVPPGDLSLWHSDPYDMVRKGDLLIGRGVDDNQQGLVSSLLVARHFLENKIQPPMNYGLLFVSDEETGSVFGLDHVLRERGDIFGKDDLFLIPDFGQPDSALIEVAEKSMFWLKITVTGRQCHASTPEKGRNSLVASADLILRIRGLYAEFADHNELFDPPLSTFEPTKKEANVGNINTLPGRDVFYVDMRVLPHYSLDAVLARIQELGREVEAAHDVSVAYETVQREQAAPATPEDAEIVRRTVAAVRRVYGGEPKAVGVGGGTVAAFLRRRGYQAVVWATLMHYAHQPNELSSIANTLGDAKVMGSVLLG
ncbi:M20 family metallo-hydrolase [Desulfovibrio aminophilus]|uniref:M20 family metallo-hydrolase n=1 Tax=Desulfovibrio aminophilus TaxID=81425 RepID=UPI003391DA42